MAASKNTKLRQKKKKQTGPENGVHKEPSPFLDPANKGAHAKAEVFFSATKQVRHARSTYGKHESASSKAAETPANPK